MIGASSVYLFFRGIQNLGLGQGTILNYTYPIFAALLAPLMIREKLTVGRPGGWNCVVLRHLARGESGPDLLH